MDGNGRIGKRFQMNTILAYLVS
ncbi:hypothetical protein QG516_04060 [Pedobacter gandavensis]|nr:hypothetical protein [Pedobacter gandavensis]WGQ12535.1 hypothetical protein QG516_04060 [Pedobacter gandavensis]